MAINWLIKSLRNALSAKLSKTNPAFVLLFAGGKNRAAFVGAAGLIRAGRRQEDKMIAL